MVVLCDVGQSKVCFSEIIKKANLYVGRTALNSHLMQDNLGILATTMFEPYKYSVLAHW
ncbi:MAG: hypothetical protein RL641_500 [Candidatus Parcubacteria bacterium]